MMRAILLLPILSAFAMQVNAKEIAEQDKWLLEEINIEGESVCVASTKDNGFLRDYYLKIQKVKNSDKPVEVFLVEDGRLKYDELARTFLQSELVLFNRIDISDRLQEFWYLPDETKKLIDTLKIGNRIEFRPYGDLDGKKIKFSLDGSLAILTKMEEYCNNGYELVEEDFAKLSDHPDSYDQNPKILEPSEVIEIRALYYELAKEYSLLRVEKNLLQELIHEYQPQITERENLRIEKEKIQNEVIPSLKQSIEDTTKRIKAGEERLQQLEKEIPQAKQRKDIKQAAKDKAYEAIAPYIPQYNELVRILNRNRADLKEAEGNLYSSRQELNSNEHEITRLERRVDSLESEIWSLKNDITSAEREERQARREYERFDSRREIDSRLRSSSRYQSAKRDAERHERQVNSLERELNSLKRDLNRSQQQLRRCEADPNNDCTREKALVDRHVTRVRNKRRQLNSEKRDLQSAERRARSIRDDIVRDVRQEERRLRDRYDHARAELNRLERRLSDAESEKDRIVRSEIPRLKDRNNELRRYISELEQYERSLRQRVRESKSNLDDYVNRVGYDDLERNLSQAKRELNQAKSVYNRLVNEKAQLERQVPQDKARLVDLNESLQSNEARLVTIKDRLMQLAEELKDFDAKKAVIEARIKEVEEQIQAVQVNYMAYFK